VSNVSLKYLRRDHQTFLEIFGENLHYDDMKIAYQLFDYAETLVQEGLIRVYSRFNSSHI